MKTSNIFDLSLQNTAIAEETYSLPQSISAAGPNCDWVADPTNETFTVRMCIHTHNIIHIRCTHLHANTHI